MSSKRKQEVSQEKKKPSGPLFSFRKSNTPAHAKAHKKDDKEETVDLHAASFRTSAKDGTDKPTSSKKVTKFFKKTFKRPHGKPPTSISEEQLQSIEHEEEKASPSSPVLDAYHSLESVKDKPIAIDVLHEPTDIVNVPSHTVPSEIDKREKAAARVQAIFRGVQARRKYKKEQQNIVKVEAIARGYLARKRVGQMKADAAAVADQHGPDHDASSA